WEREIDKMMRWGAVVTAEERAPLVDYFSAHFAPTPVTAHVARQSTAAEATYKRACLTCHESDLIEQQHLSRAGWVREVDKMIRWGASVPDTEKEALVDWLTSRYGEL
ncbi:MAG: cytochrome c, partial [Vicinamibacterales bacterium]